MYTRIQLIIPRGQSSTEPRSSVFIIQLPICGMHTFIPLLFGSCNRSFLPNLLCSPRPRHTQEQKFNHVNLMCDYDALQTFAGWPHTSAESLLTQLVLLVLKCKVPNLGPHGKARTQKSYLQRLSFVQIQPAVCMFIKQRMFLKYKAGPSFSQQRLYSLKVT